MKPTEAKECLITESENRNVNIAQYAGGAGPSTLHKG